MCFRYAVVVAPVVVLKVSISLVRRTGFVLPLEHPSGTKYVNSPQLQRLLDKKRQATDSFVSVFLLSRSSRGCKWVPFGAGLLVRLLQPLLLYYSPLSFQPNSSLTIFSTSSALLLQTKTDTTLLLLRRHLNQSCGMYCVICFVTSYPRMTDLSTGNIKTINM